MRAMAIVANYTSWSRESLLEMDVDELVEWVNIIPKNKHP